MRLQYCILFFQALNLVVQISVVTWKQNTTQQTYTQMADVNIKLYINKVLLTFKCSWDQYVIGR